MIIVMGTMTCDPAQAERYAAESRLLVEATRKEAGCLDYAVLADDLAVGRFVTIERWASEDALKAHMASPHVAHFISQSLPMLRGANLSMFDAINERPLA